MTQRSFSRRSFISNSGAVALAALAGPGIVRAQSAILKTTAWGGKWSEVMRAQVIPIFEKDFKCKVETDTAGPFLPKLQATPRNAPLYDVLHANTNSQWQAASEGL